MTSPTKKLLLLSIAVFVYSFSFGQIEVARLQTKDFNAFGFGSFLNFSVPVTQTDAVSIEGGFTYFTDGTNNVAIAPVLGGYRKILSNNDYGFYVEPMVGYTFGGSDIQRTDANGYGLTDANGNEVDRAMKGPTACVNFGYLFERARRIQFNMSMRYEHIFVVGDPALNVLSLRVTYGISFGRRN